MKNETAEPFRARLAEKLADSLAAPLPEATPRRGQRVRITTPVSEQIATVLATYPLGGEYVLRYTKAKTIWADKLAGQYGEVWVGKTKKWESRLNPLR